MSIKHDREMTPRDLKFLGRLVSMETAAHGLTTAERRQPSHVVGLMLERLGTYVIGRHVVSL